MLKLTLSILTIAAVATFTNADAPTEDNWSEGLNNYIGTFHMYTGENDEPSVAFQSHWAEPHEIFQYSSSSVGDAPASRGVGFCFWNEKEKRPEFNEIEFRDGERTVHEGYCIDMTGNTMTWIVTSWSKDGEISQIKMTDTHHKSGLNRATEHISGKKDEDQTTKWVKVSEEK